MLLFRKDLRLTGESTKIVDETCARHRCSALCFQGRARSIRSLGKSIRRASKRDSLGARISSSLLSYFIFSYFLNALFHYFDSPELLRARDGAPIAWKGNRGEYFMTRILSKASDERVTCFASNLTLCSRIQLPSGIVRLYGNCIAYRGSILEHLCLKFSRGLQSFSQQRSATAKGQFSFAFISLQCDQVSNELHSLR